MKIAGLQKMTLLDYPGKVACTVFLDGCNFRCPFCHNGELLDGGAPFSMEEEAFFTFLRRRQGLLDGVCVSGGEPTIHRDLPAFISRIKALGFSVKLDTNGTSPAVLRELVEQGAVDYVAMDIKNAPEAYALTAGVEKIDPAAVEESVRILLSGAVDYELRTTVVSAFHDVQRIAAMGEWIVSLGGGKRARRWFLQPFVDRETVRFSGLQAPESGMLEAFLAALAPCAEQVSVRGSE